MSRSNLYNGMGLVAMEATKLLNIPLVQDVAHHMGKLAAALKTPEDNDTCAREVADHVKHLVDALDRAFEDLELAEFFETNGSETLLGLLVELQELCNRLGQIHSELQKIPNLQYKTKLASQSRIQDGILRLKEELGQINIRVTACTYAILMHFHHATAQAQHDTRRVLGQRIRTLDRNCQSLRAEVNAMQAMRLSDEQKIANLVLMNSRLIFF
ncbi:hypothetical protein OPQ81_002426 [Rhizoctonia solani]|nr:hypothetical protein OPQ81_002426 [Rhizoctonia solani]